MGNPPATPLGLNAKLSSRATTLPSYSFYREAAQSAAMPDSARSRPPEPQHSRPWGPLHDGLERRRLGHEPPKLGQLIRRLTPPIALSRSGTHRRLEPEGEAELLRLFVLVVCHDELPSDVDLECRTITPVVGAPLEQEHV